MIHTSYEKSVGSLSERSLRVEGVTMHSGIFFLGVPGANDAPGVRGRRVLGMGGT